MDKINAAIKRIQTANELNNGKLFMGHSGGKDSCVIYDLCMKALPDLYVVHNIKPMLGTSGTAVGALTEMHPETLEFIYTDVCKKHHVHFFHSSGMKDFLNEHRFTCQVDGSRVSEYTRAGKSSEFIKDGKNVSRKDMTEYVQNGIFGLNMCYAIYDWSDADVFDYIMQNQLTISDEYIKNGELDAYKKGQS